jgi:hypothetical protein
MHTCLLPSGLLPAASPCRLQSLVPSGHCCSSYTPACLPTFVPPSSLVPVHAVPACTLCLPVHLPDLPTPATHPWNTASRILACIRYHAFLYTAPLCTHYSFLHLLPSFALLLLQAIVIIICLSA